MTFDDLRNYINTFERNSDFSASDLKKWQIIRFQIFKEILQEKCIFSKPKHSNKKIKYYIKKTFYFFESLFFKNPFVSQRKSILIYGHERRRKNENNCWEDIYLDSIIKNFSLDYIYLENNHQGCHYKPTCSHNVKFVDIIRVCSEILYKLKLYSTKNNNHFYKKLLYLQKNIKETFNVDINLISLASKKISVFEIEYKFYSYLLRKIQPKIAVIVVSYSKLSFIEACQDCKVPVIELQHGTMSEYHSGYSFPNPSVAQIFPDYLFLFGEFWSNITSIPLPKNRLLNIGFSHLEENYEKNKNIQKENKILILSQAPLGFKLLHFAKQITELEDSYDVVYKLHPDEYFYLNQEDFNDFSSSKICFVSEKDASLYHLLAKSKIVVGISSTALYEALFFDCKVFIYKNESWEYMKEAIQKGFFDSFNSYDEFKTKIKRFNLNHSKLVDLNQVFLKNSLHNFKKQFNKICKDEEIDITL